MLCGMEQIYVVDGMTCGHCTAAVEEEVSSVSGVLSVTADLATKRVAVQGEGYADADVRAAIVEAGYEAT
jgi:copper chaperone